MQRQDLFIEELKAHGVGVRSHTDKFFINNNQLYSQLEKRLGFTDLDDENLCHSLVDIACHIPGCTARFDSLPLYESHYNTVHRYLCCECKKNLPSAHLLDLHCAESHDSYFAVQAERGPAYCCYVQQCPVKFLNPEERRRHCIKVHKFPADFRFDALRQQKKKTKPPRKNKNPRKHSATASDTPEKMITEDVGTCSKKAANVPVSKHFSFGHSKNRGFMRSPIENAGKSVLETEDMFVDLKASLPE